MTETEIERDKRRRRQLSQELVGGGVHLSGASTLARGRLGEESRRGGVEL
jgi:hypothetical protein